MVEAACTTGWGVRSLQQLRAERPMPDTASDHRSSRAFRPCVCSCSEVAKDLRCNLCVYDYSGYGESAGTPSVPNTLADISSVFACAAPAGPTLLLGDAAA